MRMLKKYMRYAGVIVLLSFSLYARNKNVLYNKGGDNLLTKTSEDLTFQILTPEVWNYMSNYGSLGGEFGAGLYGYSWPGGAAVNNYYLWGSYFVVGAKVGGRYYTTYTQYPPTNGMWEPNPDFIEYSGPGKSVFDVLVSWDDFKSNPRNSSGRHLGVKVIIRTLSWPHEPYNDFIAHEIYIIYDKTQSDISGAGDYLDSVFVGMWYDCDVSNADASNPHIDDLVGFNGWTHGEWDNPDFTQLYDNMDVVTHLSNDTFLSEPDGIPDFYFIWGDEPEYEKIIDSTCTTTISQNGNTYLGYLIPYGMSYIYDGDDPAQPGDDVGEDGASAGYIGGVWIYTPPTPSDSITVNGTDTCRMIRPWSHQWWNWESDPATDEDVYAYLKGKHPATLFYRYAPHPKDIGFKEFDYRFLNTVGPFRLKSGDTLKLVWVVGVGQGLDGGDDSYWGRGWQRGLRHVIEWAFKAYYAGDAGDPLHPTPPKFDPNKDTHWKIPVPPPAPLLRYSPSPQGVALAWDNTAENYIDPLKGRADFVKYRVYRAIYQPLNFELIAEITPDANGNIAHSYVDNQATPGYPYYYAVTAVDEDGLESPTNNYLKDEYNNPKALIMPVSPTLENDVSKVYVTPNPFKGSAKWSQTEVHSTIAFMNLPPSCNIYIFTFSGKFVKKIVHRSGTGMETWNLLNEDGIKVSSGVYIYKVEAPDGSYKMGKFVILD